MAVVTIDYTDKQPGHQYKYDGMSMLCPKCGRVGAMLQIRQGGNPVTQLVFTHKVTVYSGADAPAASLGLVRILSDRCEVDSTAIPGWGSSAAQPRE